MSWPEAFQSHVRQKFPAEAEELLDALSRPAETSVLINPSKPVEFEQSQAVLWNTHARRLQERPSFTKDPHFHAGAYYPQESSSMFLTEVLHQLKPELPTDPWCLDLCAAPGGKSINLLNALNGEGVLFANEVMKPRAAILAENLTKWGSERTIITQNDPTAYEALYSCFDVVLVDAPCSGEGMFRKDPEAADHWNESLVELCAGRQRRILESAVKALKEGGFLIYATCTFNTVENDEIVRWLLDEFALEVQQISVPNDAGILQDEAGLRFFPHRVPGEGLFMQVFRRTAADLPAKIPGKKLRYLPQSGKTERTVLQKATGWDWFMVHHNIHHAFPANMGEALYRALEALYIVQVGTPIGQLRNEAVIPEHAWCMNPRLNQGDFPVKALDRGTALQYLARATFELELDAGWHRVTHQGFSLGYAKGLGSRWNNYYPKQWRIRHL